MAHPVAPDDLLGIEEIKRKSRELIRASKNPKLCLVRMQKIISS